MSLSKLSPLSKLFKLPNEVLSYVLANPAIPLRRRLHLRLLSNRCCDIIEDALKLKSSLVIREKDAFYYRGYNYKPDDVIIKSGGLTSELITLLCRLFPGTTELTLALGSSNYWSTVPSLFANLSTTLTTVKLFGDIEDTEVEPLATALASLSTLTSLTLLGHYPTDRLSLFGPVLSRLQKFACPFYLSNCAPMIASSLSPRCTHLQLNYHVFTAFSGPFLAQLSTSLTHLHLGFCLGTTIWQSLSGMHRLSSLSLDLNYSTLDSSLFSHLAPFTRLTDLNLYRLKYLAPLALPAKKETPFPGIKRLTLGFCAFSDYTQFDCHLFCQTLSVWFPSLLHLTLIFDGGNIAAMRARLGKLPFAVEILDEESVYIWSADW